MANGEIHIYDNQGNFIVSTYIPYFYLHNFVWLFYISFIYVYTFIYYDSLRNQESLQFRVFFPVV